MRARRINMYSLLSIREGSDCPRSGRYRTTQTHRTRGFHFTGMLSPKILSKRAENRSYIVDGWIFRKEGSYSNKYCSAMATPRISSYARVLIRTHSTTNHVQRIYNFYIQPPFTTRQPSIIFGISRSFFLPVSHVRHFPQFPDTQRRMR